MINAVDLQNYNVESKVFEDLDLKFDTILKDNHHNTRVSILFADSPMPRTFIPFTQYNLESEIKAEIGFSELIILNNVIIASTQFRGLLHNLLSRNGYLFDYAKVNTPHFNNAYKLTIKW